MIGRIKKKSSSLIWWEPRLFLLIVWSLRKFGNKKRRFWMSSWLTICMLCPKRGKKNENRENDTRNCIINRIHEVQKRTYFLTRRISDTFQTVSFLSSSLDIQLNCVCCRRNGGVFFLWRSMTPFVRQRESHHRFRILRKVLGVVTYLGR